jgi:hypothetical protein
MYTRQRKRQCCAADTAPGFAKGAPMIFAPQFGDDTDRRRRRDQGRRPAPQTPQISHELCDAILNALSRDDRLRHDYVRRRWHGLIEVAPKAGCAGDARAVAGRMMAR